MRFSSDQELFEQNSNQQQNNPNPKPSLKKKQKKQTMLSKFLDSLNQNVITKLHNYEKLKRPIFERRAIVPQKLSLYEDILFVLIFKQNQQKILSDSKEIKTICLDLQSRTKRKQCTIRQRVQKKLCKMSPQELLDHVANDKDISFNLKKVLTSGVKVQSERTINRSQVQIPSVKQKFESKRTPIKNEKMNSEQFISEGKNYDKVSMKLENSPSKLENQIFFQKEINQDQIKQERKQTLSTQEFDDNEIFIIFKKNETNESILMFNKVLVEKEIKELKQKQQQEQQRQEMMKQLKIQMDIIMHFKKKNSSIPQQVKALIIQAQKIMKILGINSFIEVQDQNKTQPQIVQQKNQLNKIHQETADKKVQKSQRVNVKKPECENQDISQFNITDQEQKNKINEANKREVKYNVQFALCNNKEYIKLYNSNPEVFEPLLWTEDEDNLVNNLIDNFKDNEKLFNLLVRYKGPEWFIERCIFLQKRMSNEELNEAIKGYKPLNISRLNGYLDRFEEKKEGIEENMMMVEKVKQMGIEC